MTDTKHTPGPWKTRHSYLDKDEIEIVPVKVRGKSNPEVGQWAELATVQTDYAKNGCGRANARLIAAAPDLLEALENLLAVNEGQGGTKYHAQNIARAAIAKAKGEPT